MRTDPPDDNATIPSVEPPVAGPPPLPPEPRALQREAVLVIQDRGRLALLFGLCTLSGVIAGFALASIAYRGSDAGEAPCPAVAQAAPAPVPVDPRPAPPGGMHFWRDPGGSNGYDMWLDPFNQWSMGRPRAWLGVTTQADPKGAGAMVSQVAKGSPAESAGLKADDVITEVDGEQIATPLQLARAIGSLEPGDKVKIEILRDGKAQTLTATVAPRP